MKSERGVTLTALVIYIMVATIVISVIAVKNANFFENTQIIKEQDKYAVEFNKFNMFFINDVKNNKTANVETKKIVFEDGTTYELKGTDIYRGETKIASRIQLLEFTSETTQVDNTTKNLIKVHLIIGKNTNSTNNAKQDKINKNINDRFNKTIEYVLKYW